MPKGVVLAGGRGTRLRPMTQIINKHLLPVYNKPMIYYPLETLRDAGIDEVMIVVGGDNANGFFELLKNGEEFGFKILEYAYQEGSGGIATALSYAERFADGEPIAVILGDNCTDADIYFNPDDDVSRARVFLKKVSDPQRFGVAVFEMDMESEWAIKDLKPSIVGIEEKPNNPKSEYAVTGLYFYPNDVFDFIRDLNPSSRGETEITDVNNWYLGNHRMDYSFLDGFWSDAGTPDSLADVNEYWRKKYVSRTN